MSVDRRWPLIYVISGQVALNFIFRQAMPTIFKTIPILVWRRTKLVDSNNMRGKQRRCYLKLGRGRKITFVTKGKRVGFTSHTQQNALITLSPIDDGRSHEMMTQEITAHKFIHPADESDTFSSADL